MAAGEDQSESVVLYRVAGIHVHASTRVTCIGGSELSKRVHLALKSLGAAHAVDCLASGGHCDPRARVGRDAFRGPVLERRYERVLDRLLGEIEVADRSDQAGDYPARLLAEDAVDGIERDRTVASDAWRP